MYMISSNQGDWDVTMVGQVGFIQNISDFDGWYEGIWDTTIKTKRQVDVGNDEEMDKLYDHYELSALVTDDPQEVYVINENEAVVPDIFFISEVCC